MEKEQITITNRNNYNDKKAREITERTTKENFKSEISWVEVLAKCFEGIRIHSFHESFKYQENANEN